MTPAPATNFSQKITHPFITLVLAAGLLFTMLVNVAQSRVIAAQRRQIQVFFSDSSHYFQLLGQIELQKQQKKKLNPTKISSAK